MCVYKEEEEVKTPPEASSWATEQCFQGDGKCRGAGMGGEESDMGRPCCWGRLWDIQVKYLARTWQVRLSAQQTHGGL